MELQVYRCYFTKILIYLVICTHYSAIADNNLYLGLDFGSRKIDYTSGYGKGLLDGLLSQAQINIGWAFNDSVAIDLGIYKSLTNRELRAWGLEYNLGIEDPTPTSTEYFQIDSKVYGFAFSLQGIYPIIGQYGVNLLGQIGMTYLKLTTQMTLTSIETVLGRAPILNIYHQEFDAYFSKKTLFPHLAIGLKIDLIESCSVKAIVKWERTSAFSMDYQTTDYNYTVRLKNTIVPMIGLVYTI
ncbi:MAG: hypothetical protein HON32_07105 [Francisellaceae bacterium]|nr:hypothetical protein [Francisellaceae bacterium]MBT6539757.1 hypothetical protein [Francisellaceae bacterium]